MILKLKQTRTKDVGQLKPWIWQKLIMLCIPTLLVLLQFCFVPSLNAQSKNSPTAYKSEVNSQSQQVKVNGVVSDESGNSLPGVSVVVEGTSVGTLTDVNGKYSIVIPAGKKRLKFSYIGYNPEIREYKNQSVINVTMVEKAKSLDEITVVGYGSQRKSDITGALSTVNVDANQAAQIHSIDQLMQGKAAGVNIVTGSGAPGSALNVQIRGLGTLSGNTQPLYVVDGVMINTATQDNSSANSNGNYYQEAQSGLTGINPEDIQNIEILKDASATAIYGSRGANGVVLITTKKGQKGKTKINFVTNTDFASMSKKIPLLQGKDYALYMNELSTTLGNAPIYSASALDSLRTMDWQDYCTRTAISQNYRLMMSASTEKTNYYLAIGYVDQQGIIKNTSNKTGDIRLNLTQIISPKLSITTNTGITFSHYNWLQGTVKNGTENSSLIRSMLRKPPVIGLDTLNNLAVGDLINQDSPQTFFNEFQDYSNEFRVISSLDLKYKFSDVFSYRLELNGDYRNKTRQQFWGKDLYFGSMTNGLATFSSLAYYSYNINSLLDFNKTFGRHRISGVAGVTYDYNFTQNSSTSSSNFFSDVLMAEGITLGQVYNPLILNKFMTSTASGLARINYTYSDKYLLTLTGRVDGASRFAPGHKYGFFPSLAGGWRINQEKWMKQLDAISNLKLRLGWGQTGVQSIGAYQTQALYAMNQYANASDGLDIGQSISRIANNNLTWETSEQLNLGLDLGLWNSRLTASVDVYKKLSSNLLQNLQIAPSTGFSIIAMNFGKIENKGIEINMNAIVLDNKAFKWEIGGNISINRNEIKSLGLPANLWGTENMSAYMGGLVSTGPQLHAAGNIFAEGHPAGMFWGLKTNGIFQTGDTTKLMYAGAQIKPGDIKYVDRNGDGIIDAKDYTFIGNPNPDFTYGIHTSLSYKSIKLDVQFTGVSGRDILNANLSMEEYSPTSAQALNIRKDAWVNAWRPDNPSNYYTRLGYGSPLDISDRFIEDGSYLRLSNVTLSYQIPVIKLGFLNSLSVYVSGNNLLLFTKYKGYDPDVNSYTFGGDIIGVDYNSYPHASTVSFGLNAGF